MGSSRTGASVRSADKKLGKKRSAEVREASDVRNIRWCDYDDPAADRARERREPVEQR